MKFTFAAAAALAIAATTASAQDLVQDRINSLFGDGFTHFSVSRGSSRTEIEGYTSDGRKVTVIIDSVTGAVLSETVERSDDGRASDRIRSIERAHAEDNDDEGDDDRYERRSSRSDRHRDDRDDDRYENRRSLSSNSDDSYDRDDRDDDRYDRDDRDDDRYERDHDDHDERDDHDDDD